MRELQDKKYTLQEVKELLREQSFEYETALSDQKERLFSLVKETEELKSELEAFKKKDGAVSAALVAAVAKAKDIEASAKQKFEANLLRLKIFDGKMAAYYKKLIAKYPMDENLYETEEVLRKMDEILRCNFMEKDATQKMFKSKNPTAATYGNTVAYGAIQPNESGFDINEALNPSKDLESLCKELGLMED